MSKKKEEVKWNDSKYAFDELDENQIEKYKSVIVQNWNKSRDAIIKVGQILMEAKDKQHKGELNEKSWLKLVQSELPFTPRTADRLIAIAKCEWITSGEYNDSLPVSWGSLYEISRLSKEQFENGIKNNSITANSIRSDIETFKKSFDNPTISAPSIESIDSSSEDNASGVKDVEKEDGDYILGNIIINKTKIMKDKKLDIEMLRNLQMEIVKAVSDVSDDLKLNFNSLNAKMKEVESKDWVDTCNLGYKKLVDTVKEEINNTPELADEYLVTAEGKMKMHEDFFVVPDLQFIAQKVVGKFGVDCLDNALKDVNFPKPYYDNLKKTAELATQVAA